MEILLRCLQFLVKIIYMCVYPLLALFLPHKNSEIPPIKNKLLTLSLVYVVKLMRQRKLKSIELVNAYIERINAVNPHINAIVEERFEDAQKEAHRADELIAKTPSNQLHALFGRYPLLGIPFTVKEACAVRKMPFVIGSLQRQDEKCAENGEVVSLLRAAGGIPLLVSANPEYCFSIETNTYTHGKCLNPYDKRRTCGGSSGGEGALNGAGASLFGVGSDIAGSIRVPSLFNGIFGHKPTAGLTSITGLFPASNSTECKQYLQVGPMTRFGRDLGLLMQVMAGRNADKLDLLTPVETKQIKIYYSLGFDSLNGFLHSSVVFDMKFAIMKAAKYFAQMGLTTQRAQIKGFTNSSEIAMSAIVRLHDFPFLMNNKSPVTVRENIKEYAKSWFGRSKYTKDALIFELMRRTNGFMPSGNLIKYKTEAEQLKDEIIQLLGSDGVLFFPTFHVPAIHHNTSHLALWGIDYTLIFNVLGLPVTHVPMGLDDSGLPIGFQVVAAPFKDKLCFQIAGELEAAFGGWTPPTPHEIQTDI